MPKGVIKKDRLDPRQSAFLAAYLDPTSDTFSNGLQSALKAGYTEGTARLIVSSMPEWLQEATRYDTMLQQAEKNLNTFVSEECEDKIKFEASKFVASRLGKNKGWCEKVETKGEGQKIEVVITDYKKRPRVIGE